MLKPKIYIDGQAGTTGLEIVSRLSKREDLELLLIPEQDRHNDQVRKQYMQQADLVFLCLPDQASVEAAKWIDLDTKVIDASTAHRTDPKWVYGFPELSIEHRQKIAQSKRVANPGCHATGFISIVSPLVQKGVLSSEQIIHCTSLTGYSGGGKKMIDAYENHKMEAMEAPQIYGLDMQHKHLKEMQSVCRLKNAPLFSPIVDDYKRGMLTCIQLPLNAKNLYSVYRDFYTNGLVHVHPFGYPGNINANGFSHRDDLEIIVTGNERQALICALFDNLGKGACGAAIQNMNLMLGIKETKGLQF